MYSVISPLLRGSKNAQLTLSHLLSTTFVLFVKLFFFILVGATAANVLSLQFLSETLLVMLVKRS